MKLAMRVKPLVTRFMLTLSLTAASASCVMADPIHLVERTNTTDAENQYLTVIKFALGDAPATGEKWPDNRVIGIYLPSKEGSDKPAFLLNEDSSLAAINYRPTNKRNGAFLLFSPKEARSVCIIPNFNERLAALCVKEKKAINDADLWVERVEGDLLHIRSQTTKGDRYTLTVRVVSAAPAAKTAEGSGSSLTTDFQLVRYERTKVAADPPRPFPNFHKP